MATVLALEEEMQLARLAAQRTSIHEARQAYEEKLLTEEKQVTLLREMLTRPDAQFEQQPTLGHPPMDQE